MRKPPAFTLIELLLATAISGVIMLGIMQGYRNAQKMLLRSNSLMDADHASCLFFNQIERDFMTAIIPNRTNPVQPPQKEGGKESSKKETVEKKSTKKKKKEKPFFFGTIFEEQTVKIKGKKHEAFQSVSLVNTNPLQVWGEKKPRQVRILYYLKKNKKKSKEEKNVYTLYRKETADIQNDSFQKHEEKSKNKLFPVKKNVVAENIKDMFLRYIAPKKAKKAESSSKKRKPKVTWLKLFEWGNNDETKNKVPHSVELRVSLWDDTYQNAVSYTCMIPVIAFPTLPPQEAKPKEKPDAKKQEEEKKKKDEATKKDKKEVKK
jgi:prepilin-type N-terminal cleavage/methylation domain-containing protein